MTPNPNDKPEWTLHYVLWGGIGLEDPGADAAVRTCEAIARLRPTWRIVLRPARLPRDAAAEFRRRGLAPPPNLVVAPLFPEAAGPEAAGTAEAVGGAGSRPASKQARVSQAPAARESTQDRDGARARVDAAITDLVLGRGRARADRLLAWRAELRGPGRHAIVVRNPPLLRFFAEVVESFPPDERPPLLLELHRLKAAERALRGAPVRDLAELKARLHRWRAEEFELLARAGSVLCVGAGLAGRVRRGLPPTIRVARLPHAAPPPELDPVTAALEDPEPEADLEGRTPTSRRARDRRSKEGRDDARDDGRDDGRDIDLLLFAPTREPELRLAIEALHHLRTRGTPRAGTLLTIAGDPDSTAARLAMLHARVLGVADRIVWLDSPGTRAPRLRRRARVGLIPLLASDAAAHRGGVPRGLFEFLTTGTPVVVSDVAAARELAATAQEITAAAREITAPADDSPVRPCGDAPREWAREIDRLLADAPLRRRMAPTARRIVERCSYEGRAAVWIAEVERRDPAG